MASQNLREFCPRAPFYALPALLSLLVCGCPSPSAVPTEQRGTEPLEAMKAAYHKAVSYSDAAELHIEIKGQGKVDEVQPIPFAVSLERPNKLRIDAFGASVVCDGKQFYGIVADPAMSDQVLFHQAPPDLTIKQVYSDPVLDQMLSDGTGIRLPQLELMLGDKPLAGVFGDDYKAKRLSDQKPADDEPACQRVEVKGEQGTYVAWIDPESKVLRRLEMPDTAFRKRYDPKGQYEFRVWAEFNGARLGKQIDDDAFKFEAPSSAMLLKWFVAPPPGLRDAPPPLLGKQLEKYKFVDFDGQPVDAASLAGKVVVFDFWFLNCPYCFAGFPHLQRVYDKFKDNDRVVILTVDTDELSLSNKTLKSAFDKASLSLPIVRDPEHFAGSVFLLEGCPTTVLLGPDGTVQDYEKGMHADLAQTLSKKIDSLLAGTDLAAEVLAKYERERDQFHRRKIEELEGTTQQIELPQAKIAERSEPATLKMTRLWTAEGFKNPGNLLVLPGTSEPRILALDGWSKVVELDLAGKIVEQHEIELPKDATITQLRTAVDGQQQRYFAGFTSLKQQVFVFDSDWKPVLTYPEGTHAGIFDVQLADLNGDGSLEINLGYAGAVGVQSVSLEGKRNWTNRMLDNVISLAVLDADAQGHRRLWCANERPAIAVLSYDGKQLADIAVPDRGVDVLVSAHLDSSAGQQFAALVSPKPSELLAIGLDSSGHELWNYPLPQGVRNTPCDVLSAGRVLAEGPGQWLLTGPDGSIHILAADGTPLDKFNYGVELTGIATAQIGGRCVLLVSTQKDLVAWTIESAGAGDTAASDRAPEFPARAESIATDDDASSSDDDKPAAENNRPTGSTTETESDAATDNASNAGSGSEPAGQNELTGAKE